jgi:hypothetical protein
MPLARLRALVRDLLHRPALRRARRGLNIALAPGQYVRRRRAARLALAGAGTHMQLDPRTGFVRFGAGEFPGLERALDLALAELARARPQLESMRARRSGKAKLVTELGSDALLAREPAFLELALSDAVLLPVVEYFGEVPWLSRISLPLTQHIPGLEGPSYFQRFHVDNDDLRHVKLYLHAQDVRPEHGPLCFLPADTSARVLRALAHEGQPLGIASVFSDEDVFRHCARSELVTLTGARGSGAFVDLSRCLHYGSRVAPGHERFVIALVYLRRHYLHVNASSQFAPRGGLDPLRTLALDPPRRYPPGTFCPDQLAG